MKDRKSPCMKDIKRKKIMDSDKGAENVRSKMWVSKIER